MAFSVFSFFLLNFLRFSTKKKSFEILLVILNQLVIVCLRRGSRPDMTGELLNWTLNFNTYRRPQDWNDSISGMSAVSLLPKIR